MSFTDEEIAIEHAASQSRGRSEFLLGPGMSYALYVHGHPTFTGRQGGAIVRMRARGATPEWTQRELRRRWPEVTMLAAYRQVGIPNA